MPLRRDLPVVLCVMEGPCSRAKAAAPDTPSTNTGTPCQGSLLCARAADKQQQLLLEEGGTGWRLL